MTCNLLFITNKPLLLTHLYNWLARTLQCILYTNRRLCWCWWHQLDAYLFRSQKYYSSGHQQPHPRYIMIRMKFVNILFSSEKKPRAHLVRLYPSIFFHAYLCVAICRKFIKEKKNNQNMNAISQNRSSSISHSILKWISIFFDAMVISYCLMMTNCCINHGLKMAQVTELFHAVYVFYRFVNRDFVYSIHLKMTKKTDFF